MHDVRRVSDERRSAADIRLGMPEAQRERRDGPWLDVRGEWGEPMGAMSGMPTLASSGWAFADASADWGAIACACSRNVTSARRSSGVSEECSRRRP